VSLDRYRVSPGASLHLSTFDPADTAEFPNLDKGSSHRVLAGLLERLAELQHVLWADGGHAVLVILQAMDTGGKDGTIRKVFSGVNPQGVDVVGFGVPTPLELTHDYLWRVHARMPAKGRIAIHNRSHYEDVLVVRVDALVPGERWAKRYDHIVAFEQMLADEGTTIVKLYLNISNEEQRRRLQARLDDPTKRWKFNPGDLETRAKWDAYVAAYEEAISRTAQDRAPWYVVPADRKWYRNLVVAKILVETLERLDLRYPDPPDLGGFSVLA
jgi:PPK2 family polyphosphate:nucleotide phosphotransferase